MVDYEAARKAGRTTRKSGTLTVSSTLATANNTPVLPGNPLRVSWLIVNTGANTARVARKRGVLVSGGTVGVPLASATDNGFIIEHWEAAGASVQDPVYALMATGDQDIYFEEVEVVP